MTFELILAYAFLINLFSLVLMNQDKKKAIKGSWRVSEKTFFYLALLGGSLGIIGGMRLFRHKTKHTTFKLGIPMILLTQFVLIIYFLTYIG